ncbi:MAG: malonyl-[acyl-carrier protein] O-methyltransferase BioC [Betaproteobacteria bacterium]|nr:MAG: malonyl-[acyl-carrier protein] O-methyltransferase BioC [Betaproteobacteria bacterium]
MDLDKQRVRRGFARAAQTYDQAAFLAREISERMSERLDLLRAVPKSVLDLGSGTGQGARMLRRRYPECVVVELDSAHAMLVRSCRAMPWWQRSVLRLKGERAARVCGDIERLPFADRAFDMVWSNLALHWTDLRPALAEVYRVLRPGGVCMFSTLGPDTLKELRAAYAAADAHVHVNRFVDLHDIGDILVQARFADPVMDMEYLRLTYADVHILLRELKAASARNANAGRPLGLSGKRTFERMALAYESYRVDSRLPATFEIVYGHAWRPETERRTRGGEAVIQVHPRRASES